MREYIDGRDVANTVMMLATAFKGTIAVVEGITDRRLYGKFFDKDKVEVVIAHSKTNVKNAVKEVYTFRGNKSIIGIVDSDLDRLNGRKNSPPIFPTDTRDSEALMLKSGAYEDIVEEYCDPDRLEAFQDKYGDMRKAVLTAAYPIGLLMYISDLNGFGLSFKDLNFDSFIDRREMRCDTRRLVETVFANSRPLRQITVKNIMQIMSAEEKHDMWEVCRGHDLMAVMAMGLRYIFGSYNCKDITDSQLSGAFRLAFDREDMAATDLYRESSEWCATKGLELWSIAP